MDEALKKRQDSIKAEQGKPIVERMKGDDLVAAAKVTNVENLSVAHGNASKAHTIITRIRRTGWNQRHAHAIDNRFGN